MIISRNRESSYLSAIDVKYPPGKINWKNDEKRTNVMYKI